MDGSIVKRIGSGEGAAAEEFFDIYGRLVWWIARRMLRNNADVEDAVQEIFMDIWRSAPTFDRSKGSEATFVATIARRRIIDRLRQQNCRIYAQSLTCLSTDPVDQRSSALQSEIEARELATTLTILRPEQRRVLELSIMDGMSHREISNTIGIPLGTVKTHARRGLLILRRANST